MTNLAPSTRLRPLAVPALLGVLVCSACKSTEGYFFGPQKTENPDDVPAAFERAAAAEEEGDYEEALEIALGTRAAVGASPELRDSVERNVEHYAALRIEQLEARGDDPDGLEDMLDYDLPRQLAVSAGLSAARILNDEDEHKDAFGLIREMDRQYPAHHERVATGELMSSIGFAMLEYEPRFFGLFGGPKKAIPPLEYLVLRYPSARRCDEAYAALAELYIADRDFSLARQRYEDLLIYHPDSPLAVPSEAQVPHLRLVALASPEYDRRGLVRALNELEVWLDRHADHELEPEVRLDLTDCLVRLARGDHSVALFYEEIEKYDGAYLHAERALRFAQRAGVEPLIEDLRAILARLPTEAGTSGEAAAEEDPVP